jgi:hypothetical protein
LGAQARAELILSIALVWQTVAGQKPQKSNSCRGFHRGFHSGFPGLPKATSGNADPGKTLSEGFQQRKGNGLSILGQFGENGTDLAPGISKTAGKVESPCR